MTEMQAALEKIERALRAYLEIPAEGQEAVLEAMRYSVQNGGKRVRPVLTLAFCRAAGGREEAAVPFACAVEMIHTYSLIHDDLPCMDNDDWRRGKPSCHKQFGEDTALLAGDGLLTLAFRTLTDAPIAPEEICRAVALLSDCAGVRGMIGGQVLDLASESGVPDRALLEKIDRLKTGALIEAACVLGCIAAGVRDAAVFEAARSYAHSVGLAFQIVDDILDVTSTREELGKPVGSDDKNEKITFVRLLGLDGCKTLVLDLTERAQAALSAFPGDTSFLRDFAAELAARRK